MRVAIVHSFYSSRAPSGENVVVREQVDVLRKAGHDVKLIARHTDEEENRRGHKLRSAWTTATGSGASPIETMLDFNPDVVHVHNLFPNWGTKWLAEWRGPLVATLHNFRPMCAAGTLYRSGSNCSSCPKHGSWNAVLHKCYRDSAVASLPLAISTMGGATHNPLLTRADILITLSRRSTGIYLDAGIPEEKLRTVPNFVTNTPPGLAKTDSDHWVFAGRLAPEKGLLELIEDWPVGQSLRIFGAGPLEDEVRSAVAGNARVDLMGPLPRHQLAEQIAGARGVVIPSRWAEGAIPLSYIEALALGRPVVTYSASAAADDAIESGAGVVYEKSHELDKALARVTKEWASFSRRASDRYQELFTPQAWLARTEAAYQSSVLRRRHSNPNN